MAVEAAMYFAALVASTLISPAFKARPLSATLLVKAHSAEVICGQELPCPSPIADKEYFKDRKNNPKAIHRM
jgi:hypothetical protein